MSPRGYPHKDGILSPSPLPSSNRDSIIIPPSSPSGPSLYINDSIQREVSLHRKPPPDTHAAERITAATSTSANGRGRLPCLAPQVCTRTHEADDERWKKRCAVMSLGITGQGRWSSRVSLIAYAPPWLLIYRDGIAG
ncbi:hypothetical protein NEOLEDRAFT_805649 [Neolentinus lepideus HHB14362 ss-1]|uniref:Uncharacterized protein n=1 Tax=Neolentinus lepideus HHB14362 ss-1 TaxID=1314782 RepID=A0A165PFP4_9AGAM|nr:hypothetical protein NEOLEDRAFT_805649 [Neolentinus lepideus HHB14362 ss-1]